MRVCSTKADFVRTRIGTSRADGIAAELAEAAHLRKDGVEIAEEVAGHVTVLGRGAVPQSQGESLHVRFEDLFEGRIGLTH